MMFFKTRNFCCLWPVNYVVFFFQDLKTNEARLQELNNIADKLTAMGKTEAAEKIREQIAVCINKISTFLLFIYISC